MVSLDFLLGVAAGLGLSGVTLLVIRWYQRRHLRRLQTAPVSPAVDPLPSPTARGSAPTPSPGEPRPVPPSERVPEGPAPDSARTEHVVVDGVGDHSAVAEETVQLSHRVLLHLYGQGVIRPDEVPPRALSQSGMSEALEVRQGALAGVLLRLEAAGVVASETTHVRGGQRRVKVYRLTDRGTQLAKELRGRTARRPRSE